MRRIFWSVAALTVGVAVYVAKALRSALGAYLMTPGAKYTVASAVLSPAAYLVLSLALRADVAWWFVAVLSLSPFAFRALGEDPHPGSRRSQ